MTFEDKVEGPRSGRRVPKQAAGGPRQQPQHWTRKPRLPRPCHRRGTLAPRVLPGCICPPQNRAHSLPTRTGSPDGLQGLGAVGGRQKHTLPVFVKAELEEGVSRKFQKIREDQHHRMWRRS